MESVTESGAEQNSEAIGRRVPRWVWGMGTAILIVAVVVLAVVAYIVHNAEPILRRRMIATLEDRFHSPVELDVLHISVLQGLQVSGSGLRILSLAGDAGTRPANAAPMVSVEHFEFRTGVHNLFEPTMRVRLVRVQGMQLHVPPNGERGPLFRKKEAKQAGQPKPKKTLGVDEIDCSDIALIIDTDKPGKQPLVFDIRDVTLHDVGGTKPWQFDARLVNPKPVGDIHSTGQFGPWHEDEPRDTPVDGTYSFTNADLDPIKGIAGTLSSIGNYSGTLGEIGIKGTTETPNFSLDVSEHPVDLHTEFDATVDGTTGDTVLNSVRATLLHTVLHVSGRVIRAETGPGHHIDISVATDHARIEDILTLGAKTSPPLMHGGLTLRSHLSIPPGHVSVSKKMRLLGTFAILGATFSNAKWQETVDNLSQRAQGHPHGKNDTTAAPVVTSAMGGNFVLTNAVVDMPKLKYELPGAKVDLSGKYSLNGDTFNFAGTVRTDATASAMLTGWKKWVAMPFDPLLKKDGAGVEVPVTISGTKSEPKFGVDRKKLKDQIFHRQKKPGDSAGGGRP